MLEARAYNRAKTRSRSRPEQAQEAELENFRSNETMTKENEEEERAFIIKEKNKKDKHPNLGLVGLDPCFVSRWILGVGSLGPFLILLRGGGHSLELS